MNRTDFQELADVRIGEAEVLLAQQRYDGAYYLAGYAVECALKACIAKLTNLHDFPPKVKVVQDCYTHRIETLISAAGLEITLKDDIQTDDDLEAYWNVVFKWTELSRYERKTKLAAEEIYKAITDPAHGVLSWLKQRW